MGGWTNVKTLKKKQNINKIVKLSEEIRLNKLNYISTGIKNENKENKIIKKFKNLENKIYKHDGPIHKNNIKVITNLSIDKIFKKRKSNYFFLKRNLPKKYNVNLKINKNTLPIGFICKLKKNRDKIRKNFEKNSIYCPIHWKIKKQFQNQYPNSHSFSESFLTLPIDHRYDIKK